MADASLRASGIYAIRNRFSGKFYIGSSVHLQKRRDAHWRTLRAGVHKNARLQRAWRKYGASAFVFEVLEYVPDRAMLIEREQHWIDAEQAVTAGYNILPKAGSCLGRKHTAETVEKMRASAKGRPLADHVKALISARHKGRVDSPEVVARRAAAHVGYRHGESAKAKISAAHKGKQQAADVVARRAEGLRGRALTAEHKANVSLAGMGRCHTPESIAKIAAAQAGRVHTAEHRAANAAARLGSRHSDETRQRIADANRGLKRTQESRERMSAARSGIPLTEEHKANLKANHRGRKGMTNSPESIARRAETMRQNRERLFTDAKECLLWVFMMKYRAMRTLC